MKRKLPPPVKKVDQETQATFYIRCINCKKDMKKDQQKDDRPPSHSRRKSAAMQKTSYDLFSDYDSGSHDSAGKGILPEFLIVENSKIEK